MKGKIITREIFNSLVARDGRFSRATQGQRNMFLQETFNNTKKYLLGHGIQIPATDGHTETQPLIGEITDMRLIRKRYTPKKGEKTKSFQYFSIVADIRLIPEFYQVYKEDRLPGASVDLALEGYLGSGQTYGPHIYAVSLMGQTPPAFPQLERDMKYESMLSFSMVPKRHYWIKTNKMEFEIMPNKEEKNQFEAIKLQVVEEVVQLLPDIVGQVIEKIASETDLVEETVAEVVAEEAPTDPAAEMPAPGEGGGEFEGEEEEEEKLEMKEEKLEMNDDEEKKPVKKFSSKMNKEVSLELEALQKDRRKLAFESLQMKGKVSFDQKKDFIRIAKNNGLEYANQFFGKMSVKVPAAGSLIKNSKEKNEEKNEHQFALDYAVKQSLPPQVLNILRGSKKQKEENK